MTMRARTAILILVMVAAAIPAASQTTSWTPPETAWGDPDLQGQWNSQMSPWSGQSRVRRPGPS